MSNSDVKIQLFSAIENQDYEAARSLINDKPELIDVCDDRNFGATPLVSAAFRGDLPMARLLIELGADANRCSDWEFGPWSPLHAAVYHGHNQFANWLLDQGACLDLHVAAALSRFDLIEQLIADDQRAAHSLGGDGCTPLHFAGCPRAAAMLLAKDADIEARCIDHHSTPLHYAAVRHPDVAKFLLRRGAVADLFSASLAGDIETIGHLIQHHAGILNQRLNQEAFPPSPSRDTHNIMTFTVGEDGTPLHAAAVGNQPAVIECLIKAGLDVDVRGGYDDATPLHLAAWHDKLDAAQSLISNGTNIDVLSGDLHHNSPAGWAIVAGSANVFEYLIDQGAALLDHFERDAQAAVEGQFAKFKRVPPLNYERIRQRI
ncbi:MAG: ankyrin repeat domain-containing protein [Planctomycetota bacterium]